MMPQDFQDRTISKKEWVFYGSIALSPLLFLLWHHVTGWLKYADKYLLEAILGIGVGSLFFSAFYAIPASLLFLLLKRRSLSWSFPPALITYVALCFYGYEVTRHSLDPQGGLGDLFTPIYAFIEAFLLWVPIGFAVRVVYLFVREKITPREESATKATAKIFGFIFSILILVAGSWFILSIPNFILLNKEASSSNLPEGRYQEILDITKENQLHNVYSGLIWTGGNSIIQRLAENSNTPPAVLSKLSEEEDQYIRSRVAKNPSVPEEVLTQLAQDPSEHVRWEVARNPNTLPEALNTIKGSRAINNALALNPNTHVETLEKLSLDENTGSKIIVAHHPNLPKETLRRLAMDKNSDVRRNVALNPAAPLDVLESLRDDDNEGVREAIRKRLSN